MTNNNAQSLFNSDREIKSPLNGHSENYIAIPNYDPLDTKINYGMLAGLTALNVGVFVAAHEYQANTWWYHKKGDFHFKWDGNYALSMDKYGHFFAAHFVTHYLSSCMQAANIQEDDAVLYASLMTFAYQLYVEIEDGFSVGYGFAPDDAIADFLGSAYALAQYHFPYLKNIQPRVSYYPSKEYLDKTTDENILDDFEGQKHWIAFKVEEMLPKSLAKYWPDFLMLSVGSGIQNYYSNRTNKHREFFIALDFDPSVIPLYGGFWEFFKNTLSYIHFPLPGIRISPKVSLFGICY